MVSKFLDAKGLSIYMLSILNTLLQSLTSKAVAQ